MTNDDRRPLPLPDREELARRALELHGKKYNCAQSVACTFAPFVGAAEDACFRPTEGLGAGMGGFTETCGAVTGAAVVIGMVNSAGMDNPTSKASTYRIVRKLAGAFRALNGSTVCSALKGIETKQPLRSCNGCITDAVDLTAEALQQLRA